MYDLKQLPVNGKVLREKRQSLGLSQKQLAEKSLVSRRTILYLEHDDLATPKTLRLLSQALGCEPKDLIK